MASSSSNSQRRDGKICIKFVDVGTRVNSYSSRFTRVPTFELPYAVPLAHAHDEVALHRHRGAEAIHRTATDRAKLPSPFADFWAPSCCPGSRPLQRNDSTRRRFDRVPQARADLVEDDQLDADRATVWPGSKKGIVEDLSSNSTDVKAKLISALNTTADECLLCVVRCSRSLQSGCQEKIRKTDLGIQSRRELRRRTFPARSSCIWLRRFTIVPITSQIDELGLIKSDIIKGNEKSPRQSFGEEPRGLLSRQPEGWRTSINIDWNRYALRNLKGVSHELASLADFICPLFLCVCVSVCVRAKCAGLGSYP
jgi:hypothetical protein